MNTQSIAERAVPLETWDALHCPPDELAHALGIDLRTLHRLQEGDRPLPAALQERLAGFMRERGRELLAAARALDADAGWPPASERSRTDSPNGQRYWMWAAPEDERAPDTSPRAGANERRTHLRLVPGLAPTVFRPSWRRRRESAAAP